MRRFLLVDDDTIFNFLHTEVIKTVDSSAQIDLFNSSTEGLQFLQEALDGEREMPHFLFEVLEKLESLESKISKDTKVYVLSSTLDDRDLSRAKSNPLVTDFIGKPLSFDAFRKLLV